VSANNLIHQTRADGRFYVVMSLAGHYIDDDGRLTWARSLAKVFTEDEWVLFMDGRLWPDGVAPGTLWTPIKVDKRGQSLSHFEPVIG